MVGNLGTTELLLIATLLMVIVGAKRLPELAKGLGKGVSEFQKGMREISDHVAQPIHHITSKQSHEDRL